MENKLEWENFEMLIDESWHNDLKPFITSKECYDIYQKLKALPKGEVIPKSNLLWRPFKECKKSNLLISSLNEQNLFNKPENTKVLVYQYKNF